MYLSHPVRRLCEDPTPEESVSLVVELTADDRYDALESTVGDLDGSVDRGLGFSTYLVSLPETAVDDLCALGGLERIETADTLSLGVDPDATEYVERDEEPEDDYFERSGRQRNRSEK